MRGLLLTARGERREVRLDAGLATLDGRAVAFREIRRGEELVGLEIEGRSVAVRVAREGDLAFVWCAGEVVEVRRETGGSARREASAETHAGLLAPMPGRVRKTLVRRGEAVAKGQVVVVLEAMKMEHAIRAPREGVVTRVAHADGDLVEAGTVLAEISDSRDAGHEG